MNYRKETKTQNVLGLPLLTDYIAKADWTMEPGTLRDMVDIFDRRLRGVQISAKMIEQIRAAKEESVSRDYEVIGNGVAVLPITGIIAKYSRMVNDISLPAGTSVERMRGMLDAAMVDSFEQVVKIADQAEVMRRLPATRASSAVARGAISLPSQKETKKMYNVIVKTPIEVCEELLAKLQAGGLTLGQAWSRVAKNHPEIYIGWRRAKGLRTVKSDFDREKVEAASAVNLDLAITYAKCVRGFVLGGMSPGQAHLKTIREMPAAHAAWLRARQILGEEAFARAVSRHLTDSGGDYKKALADFRRQGKSAGEAVIAAQKMYPAGHRQSIAVG